MKLAVNISLKIIGLCSPKGAIIGPLVICGLMTDEKNEKKLKEIGVKDSKQLTPKRREGLVKEIEKIATHIVVLRIPACKIDANRKRGINLNQIEALKMAEIINLLEPDKAIVDAPSFNTSKFRDYLLSKIENKNFKLICENYADENYPVVSAASIIAKVNRDENIEELKRKVGFNFGVGYSHDPLTIEFLNKLTKENRGKLPTYVRNTWDTVKRIKKEYSQPRILSFFKQMFKKKKTTS
ncbi:MAG: ribonuclease HII [Candidatus Aenigmarchaeota archaeon]|nr:ribonuclease HII [Candidatus Aenigmarchaeota archaeon]